MNFVQQIFQWIVIHFFFFQCNLGLQKIDGIYGSIVVRQPPSQDPNSHLYDYDLTTHVILLSDWMHEDAMERFPGRLAANTGQDPESLLINGKGQFTVSVREDKIKFRLDKFPIK